MAGLLGFMAAGAAQGYGRAGEQNTQMQAQFNLTAMQDEIRAMMDQRIYERSRADRATDRAQDKADRIEAQDRQFAHDKELIAARGKEERRVAAAREKAQDPNKEKLSKLQLEEAERKAHKGQLADEINAARAAVEYNEGMDPKDRTAATRYLDQQQQGLLGKPKPETEEVTEKTKEFTDQGEKETTTKRTRPVEKQPNKASDRPSLDSIFSGQAANKQQEVPSAQNAELPQMSIQQVYQELKKMGQPMLGWTDADYQRYNQLRAMQKSLMGR